jgi:hypothetical protein
MLRCAQHDRGPGSLVTLSAAKGLSGWAPRCFAALSMTGVRCPPEGSLVTLSRSEGPVCMGVKMLRGVSTEHSECAQHDRAVLLPRHRSYSI